MQKLKDFQKKFLYAIDHGEKLENINGAGSLNSHQATQVYKMDYILRLSDFLGDRFEACWKVLGDEDFLKSAEDYINQTPSKFKSLALYGETFCDFLHKKYQDEFPFLRRLAKLEWEYNQYFNSAFETKTIDLALEEKLQCSFSPLSQTKWYTSAFDLIYIFKNKSNDIEITWEDIERPRLNLLYKVGYQVYFESFPVGFLLFMELISQGNSLEETILKCSDLQIDEKQWAKFYMHFFCAFRPSKI